MTVSASAALRACAMSAQRSWLWEQGHCRLLSLSPVQALSAGPCNARAPINAILASSASLTTRHHPCSTVARWCSTQSPDQSSLTALAEVVRRSETLFLEQSRHDDSTGQTDTEQVFLTLRSTVESLEAIVQQLGRRATQYDPYPGVECNGVRSCLRVLFSCIPRLTAILERLRSTSTTARMRRQQLCQLEGHARLLADLTVLLQNVMELIEADVDRHLIVDRSKLRDDFVSSAELADRRSFYGACLGLQYDKEIRPVLAFLVGAQAATGTAYLRRKPTSTHRLLRHILPSVSDTVRVMSHSERAKVFLDVTSRHSQDFAKRFWSLAEMKILQLDQTIGRAPKLKSNELIHVPPEIISFDQDASFSHSASNASSSSSSSSFTDGVCTAVPLTGAPISIPPPLSDEGKPEGVTVRHLLPKGAGPKPSKGVILHFHGGGFIAQTSKSHLVYLRQWCDSLNVPIVSVDYQTAPEHAYPRAVNDCLYAYAWLLKNRARLGTTAERVVFAGDSAGGNFVFSVALLAAKYGLQRPDLLFAAYPVLQVELDPSPGRCLSLMDPLLPIGVLIACLEAYRGSTRYTDVSPNTSRLSIAAAEVYRQHYARLRASPAYLSPLLAQDSELQCLPKAFIMPAHLDPLVDDSVVMARRLHKLGKPVTLYPVEGVCHGFLNFYSVSRLARQACNKCADIMAETLNK